MTIKSDTVAAIPAQTIRQPSPRGPVRTPRNDEGDGTLSTSSQRKTLSIGAPCDSRSATTPELIAMVDRGDVVVPIQG